MDARVPEEQSRPIVHRHRASAIVDPMAALAATLFKVLARGPIVYPAFGKKVSYTQLLLAENGLDAHLRNTSSLSNAGFIMKDYKCIAEVPALPAGNTIAGAATTTDAVTATAVTGAAPTATGAGAAPPLAAPANACTAGMFMAAVSLAYFLLLCTEKHC